MKDRILRELAVLKEGGQQTTLYETPDGRSYVIYRDVPADGQRLGLPGMADVVVPVPPAYPGAMIDLAGLPTTSPFLTRVKGQKSQGMVAIEGQTWQLCSYHPHTNGGGPPWNPTLHGFHTYLGYLMSWLGDLQ